MQKTMQLVTLHGKEILPHLPDLANLGLKLFREYPYLFEMVPEDQNSYGKRYAECADAIMVMVVVDNKIVGASTAMPLTFDVDAFKNPFIGNNIPVEDVFYLGESVLLSEHRGQGIYREFFKIREQVALDKGYRIAAFSTVERDANDFRRPQDYVPLDAVWEHFGYKKKPRVHTYFEWKDVSENCSSSKKLVFWLKTLE